MQLMGIRLEQPPQADAAARWLRPPRLRTLAEVGERHASWLELFFDLVFVVAITELSHYLVVLCYSRRWKRASWSRSTGW
jgi:low temperature requirement protein LtrA